MATIKKYCTYSEFNIDGGSWHDASYSNSGNMLVGKTSSGTTYITRLTFPSISNYIGITSVKLYVYRISDKYSTNNKTWKVSYTTSTSSSANYTTVGTFVAKSSNWTAIDIKSFITSPPSSSFYIKLEHGSGSNSYGETADYSNATYKAYLEITYSSSSTLYVSNGILEEPCLFYWTPGLSTYHYKLHFSIGSWSATTDVISPNKTTTYQYYYTFPIEIAQQLPYTMSGTMTASLYTYSNSSCTTQIGSVSSKTFIITIPNTIIPTIDSFTVTIDNSSNDIIQNWGVNVAGYSRAKLDATASGVYNSKVSSFIISGGTYSTTQTDDSLSWVGGVINSSGYKTFTVVAKDSRGQQSKSKSINNIYIYPYSKPIISNFTIYRSESDQSNIVVNASWNYSLIGGKNYSTAVLHYKEKNSKVWIPYDTPIENGVETVLKTSFDETSSFDFQIIVSDALEDTAEEASVTVASVLLDFKHGGKGLGIGKICEEDGLEIAFDTKFLGNISIRGKDLIEYILSEVHNSTHSSWNNLELNNGITAVENGYEPRYRKIGNHVYLEGQVQIPLPATNPTYLGVLPEGFRPLGTRYFIIPVTSSRIARIYVSKSGNIALEWIYSLTDNTNIMENTGSISWLQINCDFYVD